MKCFRPILFLIVGWAATETEAQGNRGLQVSEDYENSTLTLDTPELDAGSIINVKRTRNRGRGGCKIYPGHYIVAGNNAAGGRKNTMQDCADWCADSQFSDSSKSCKAWTFHSASKYCWLKTTDRPMGCPGGDCSTSQWVSGTKNCGDIRQSCPHCGDPCSSVLNVQGKLFPDGKYARIDDHQYRPAYKHEAGKMCIFFARHWKVDWCSWLKDSNSQGLAWSKIDPVCPQYIGQGWRYYYGGIASESDPIEPSIKITG